MRKSRLLIVFSLMVLALLLGLHVGMQVQPATAQTGQIHTTLLPLVCRNCGATAPPPQNVPNGSYWHIVMAVPIQEATKQALLKLGVEIMGYYHQTAYQEGLDDSYIARMDEATRARVETLPGVLAVIPYAATDKLTPDLASIQTPPPGIQQTSTITITVGLFPGESSRSVVSLIGQLDGKILDVTQAQFGSLVRAIIAPGRLLSIAELREVAWISSYEVPVLGNDVARQVMAINPVWENHNLFGQGQTVAVADTGLDTGNLGTLSADFAGRVAAAFALGRPVPANWNDPDGHGTHVAGSVLGNGSLSGSNPATHNYTASWAGVAPEARLVIQSLLDSGGGLGGIPADYNTLFQQAYNAGARIHTNSWGGPGNNASASPSSYALYDTNVFQIDQFLWNHKDMTILFLTHNNGSDSDSNGVVDQNRLARQAAAKNIVAVGAAETNRPEIGNTWGPPRFPVAPINGDAQANNPAGMAAFSSRGPTQDNRIKPDVVAPGTWIVSARSHVAPVSPNDIGADYTQKSGTSMATPLTAGTAALIREYYQTQRGLSNPSGALIKATLINGAVDLNPGQYGVGATQEMGAAPNVVEGWGRVDLSSSIYPANGAQVRFDDEQIGLLTGGTKTYTFIVNDSSIPFRVTMSYTDYPGWPSDPGAQLRNDLDMRVIAPDGTVLYPNNLGGVDRRNNVERVVVNNPLRGVYTVRVDAYNVPFGPQPYALVATGAFGPRLDMTKRLVTPATGPAHVGDLVTFDITITNASGTIITSLPLEERFEDTYLQFVSATPQPDNILGNTLRWNDLTGPAPHGFGGDLGLNNSVRVRVNFRAKDCPPNQAAADVATVTGAIADDLPVPTASATGSVDIACPKVSLTKTLTSPASGMIWPGVTGQDQATFTLKIQNTGNKPVTTLPLSDTYNPDHLEFVRAVPPPTSSSPGTLTWANLAGSGPIQPGQTVAVLVTLKAVGCPPDQLATNTVSIQGAVATHNGQTFDVPDVGASATVTIPCPYVSVKKTLVTPASGTARLGDPVTFNIEVKATGNKPVVFAQLEDEFDSANLQFVSADPPPDSVVGNSILWNDLISTAHGFGRPLLPGESFNINVVFTAQGCPPQQTSVNRARITRITAMHDGQQFQVISPAADVASVDIACPELKMTKTLIAPTQNDVRLKETARFQITIQNTGNKAVVGLPLVDTFDPAYLEFLTASIPPDTVAPGVLSWHNLVAALPLQPGASLSLTLDFRAVGCPPDQLTSNTAQIQGAIAQHGGITFPVPDVSSTYPLRIPCPDMVLKKTLLSPTSGVIGRGEEVTFRIQITATGNKPLIRVPLVDTFDHRYLVFVSATLPPDDVQEGELIWDDLTGAKTGSNGFGTPLLPGETFTVDVTFRQNGCPPGQVTRNTARADDVIARHDGRDYQVPSDSDSASIKIACPEATVTKTRVTQQPPECPKAGLGDQVTFNVVIRNTGNTTLVKIPLIDVYEPAYLQFDSAVPQPNSVVPLVGSLTWDDLTGPLPFGFDRDLKPGESFMVTLNFTALKSTQNLVPPVTTDTATVVDAIDEYGYTAPTSTSSASVEIADADLFVSKRMLSTGLPNLTGNQIVAGEVITYEITYGNNGPDDVDHARLVDLIPPGTVFIKDTLCGHANTGCFLGHIQAGFSSTFLLTVQVPLRTLPGTVLTNTVQIESGQTVTGPICDVKDATPGNNRATATSVVVADFGDAVEPPYRTRLASGGAYHGDFTKEWLGAAADGETDANFPDNFDDGVDFRSRQTDPGKIPWYRLNQPMEMFVTITTSGQKAARYGLAEDRKLYLRAWIDWNRDGAFDPATEQVIEWSGAPGRPGTDGGIWPIAQNAYTVRFTPSAAKDTGDYTWIRFRLSYGSPPQPDGQIDYGEVEDYQVGVFAKDP